MQSSGFTESCPELDFIDLASVDMQASPEIITQDIMKQMTTAGFLYLSNVPDFDEDELFKWSKWFFALPEEVKSKLIKQQFNNQNANVYRGLSPFIDNDPSHKELYEVGLDLSQVSEEEKECTLHEETPWPEGAEGCEEFREYMLNQYKVMHAFGMKILSHIAMGLGKQADFFERWFKHNTCSTLRIIHYKPRKSLVVKHDQLPIEDLKYVTPIHTDSGFLTFLSTFGYSGLQVHVGDGVFKSVRPVPKTLVVNLGDMLSRITGYKLRATKHCVLDIGVERYSAPFFLEPCYLARIPSNVVQAEDTDAAEQLTEFIYGDWVIEKMS
jgi:isopenicillin N synthase-like dioxygenase